MNWVALKTVPTHRIEFHVLHRITQREHPAMLPFEVVMEKRHGKRRPVPKNYALFPRYVFAGLADIKRDYWELKAAIPEIQGIVSRSRDDWSPLVLTQADVSFVASLVDRASVATEVNLHKALAVGKNVEVSIGGSIQETRIDSITKRGIKALLRVLGDMPMLVEVPFDAVRAA